MQGLSLDGRAGSASISAVILDAGNTLVYVDRVRMREIFRETAGVEVDEACFLEAEHEARLSLARAVEAVRAAVDGGRDGEGSGRGEGADGREPAADGEGGARALADHDGGARALADHEGGARALADADDGAPPPSGTEDHVWREYFLTLFRECGVSEADMPAVGERIKEIHDADHLWSHVEEDTAAVLDALLEAGYRLAVVSNADGRVERLLEDVGVRDRFEFVLDSHVVGVEKPDPRIFLQACERLGVEPERCLYVGDLYPVDVVGARAAGLRAVLLDPLGRLEYPVDTIRGLGELISYLADAPGAPRAVGEEPPSHTGRQ